MRLAWPSPPPPAPTLDPALQLCPLRDWDSRAVIWEASLTAAASNRLVAAVINVRDSKHDMTPLLAFALASGASAARRTSAILRRTDSGVMRLSIAS